MPAMTMERGTQVGADTRRVTDGVVILLPDTGPHRSEEGGGALVGVASPRSDAASDTRREGSPVAEAVRADRDVATSGATVPAQQDGDRDVRDPSPRVVPAPPTSRPRPSPSGRSASSAT